MRTTLKIILPLIVSVATVSLFFAAYQVRTEKSALRSDLSHRAEILGESLQESVEPLLDRAADKSLQRLVERFGQREHLKGVAVYSKAAAVLAITSGLPPALKMRPTAATRAAQEDIPRFTFMRCRFTITVKLRARWFSSTTPGTSTDKSPAPFAIPCSMPWSKRF